MKTSLRLTAMMALVWGIGWFPSSAPAQIISVSVGNDVPVKDQIGRVLPGVNNFSNSSSLVEIRQTTPLGVIIAPDPDTGAGHPANPLMANSYIGKDAIFPGFFSETFTNRLCPTNLYFARVFDNPQADKAIYYADTAPFEGTSNDVANIIVTFGAWKLRSTGEPDIDSDGDGIPDEMENNITGTSPNDPDHDGDGFSDLFEVLFSDYLNPTEADARLELAIHAPAELSGDPHTVSWDTIAVPNMTYRLEFTDELDFENPYIEEIWSGTATETHLVVDVEDWVTNSLHKGFFRVVVPYDVP
ncbi:MAG TPA: thrombospondin type 3 repeat-containing protein [Kiritimatiellia bacterium]|jgi:hypothetical protein|nr:hypothetical protein [Kiritimatiellia bacterium]OQC55627.1 MAG: hypothetical protein BWX54_01863 [Verrucomicrobia bacterium ADurb.Bin018]HOD99903.1 thrombospondin type 3 repeat-containing protein [Kiritimatiellia bacterium]HOE36336.1 thrombospondin type 3 repeat-containing protein [Kiritimatiellia bacterium]HOR73904.1 thrombospondin type 3 repeat-containing protein [Kiritimatiellia bacterium]